MLKRNTLAFNLADDSDSDAAKPSRKSSGDLSISFEKVEYSPDLSFKEDIAPAMNTADGELATPD